MIENKTHVYFLYSKDFLSNFHPSEYTVDGNKFYCVEQGYQYEKAMFFGDVDIANEILLARNPYDHKRLGRSIHGFDENLWVGEVSVKAMHKHCYEKFSQNTDLCELLLITGNRCIVEASDKDTFWGCGIKIDNPLLFETNWWTGRNILGRILVQVRHNLRSKRTIF